jgi:MFS family permease
MDSLQQTQPKIYYGWYIVATCFFVAFLTVGAINGFGIFVIPMSEDLGWNRTTISFAAALGFLVSGVTQPFIGYMFDHLGGRRVIIIGLAVVGIAAICLAFTFHFLFFVLMFSLVLSTALSGSSMTNTMALISKWFHQKRATAVSVNSVGGSMGGLVLVPLAMYFMQATSWRWTWAALGMVIIGLAVPMCLMFLKNDPSEIGLLPDGIPNEYPNEPIGTQSDTLGDYEVDNWKESFKTPPMWQLSASYVVCGITTGITSTHFVPLAIERGAAPSTAAIIFGLMMGLNVFGGLGAGVLSDKFKRKNILAAVYFMRGLAYVVLLVFPSTLGLWAFAVISGFSWVASVPLTSSLTADVYGLRALGTISGVTFFCHQVGSFAMILLAGILFDATGSYTIPFAIAGAFLFPAAIAAFTIKEDKYSARYSYRVRTATSMGY